MNDIKSSYDQVPYSSFTFPQTRPDRLATLATFFGMSPAPPEKCRVLELGCGDGTNLISFAYILPECEFVGIDISDRHIEQAKQTTAELGLTNLSFFSDDVMNFDRERFGEFDYIVAHGMYSWVPDPVRAKMLEIYGECLAPHGVGYISFNAYPGCHIREIFWNMMRYRTDPTAAPMDRVHRGLDFVKFIANAAEEGTFFKSLSMLHLAQFKSRTAENVFHDEFANPNQPFYFHEFAETIQPHGLQFLSDVDALWIDGGKLEPEVSSVLDELGDDIVRREQYIDFIKCNAFRSVLVCRKDVALDRQPTPAVLEKFLLVSDLQPKAEAEDTIDNTLSTFVTPDGREVEVHEPFTKAILSILNARAYRALRYQDLLNEAREIMPDADSAQIATASDELFQLAKAGFVSLHLFQPRIRSEPGEYPASSAFVRWQIRRGCSDITNLSGINLVPDSDFMRLMLLLADGTRDRQALLRDAMAQMKVEESRMAELAAELPGAIESRLAEFARLGLLLD